MANQKFSKAGNPIYAFTEKDERKFESEDDANVVDEEE